MKRKDFFKLFLVVMLIAVFPVSAHAAVGDFIPWPSAPIQLNGPSGVAVDSSGNVYVADTGNSRIQIFDSAGAPQGIWEIPQYVPPPPPDPDNPPPPPYPIGIAVDEQGNVYVADSSNFRILILKPDEDPVEQVIEGPEGSLASPRYIALGSPNATERKVYVTVSWGQVSKVLVFNFNLLNRLLTKDSTEWSTSDSQGIAVDDAGNIFVADRNSKKVQIFFGNSTVEWTSNWKPYGIAVDACGLVYVTSYLPGPSPDAKIRVFDATTCTDTTCLPRAEWGGYGTGNGQFIDPTGIAVDSLNNRVYVVDRYNNRIQVIEGFGGEGGSLTANAGPEQTVEQTSPSGRDVTLSGSGSTAGCGGNLEEYEWTWPGGSVSTGDAAVSLSLPAGKTTVSLRVRSGTVWSQPDTVDITVLDTSPPTTTANVAAGTLGSNGYYVSNVDITLTASDSGSGIKEIHGQVDPLASVLPVLMTFVPPLPSGTAPLSVTGDGNHEVKFYAVDNAIVGANNESKPPNTEGIKSITVKIDTTPPAITYTRTPGPNAYGWNNTPVVVDFTTTDNLSGVATEPSDVTFMEENGGQSVTVTATDNAGNSTQLTVGNINIDKTPPTVTISGVQNGGVYELCAVPTPGYTGTDLLSGFVSGSGSTSLTGGNANGVGNYTYTVTNAADQAGNTSSASAAYSVQYNFWGFVPPMGVVKYYKLGWPLPVMFWLGDGCKHFVSTAKATLWLQNPDGQLIPGKWKANISGNDFKYDNFFKVYYFNLDTKPLSVGKWKIIARLDDGTEHVESVEFFK